MACAVSTKIRTLFVEASTTREYKRNTITKRTNAGRNEKKNAKINLHNQRLSHFVSL